MSNVLDKFKQDLINEKNERNLACQQLLDDLVLPLAVDCMTNDVVVDKDEIFNCSVTFFIDWLVNEGFTVNDKGDSIHISW